MVVRDNDMTIRTAQLLFKKFPKENTSLLKKEGSGRPFALNYLGLLNTFGMNLTIIVRKSLPEIGPSKTTIFGLKL